MCTCVYRYYIIYTTSATTIEPERRRCPRTRSEKDEPPPPSSIVFKCSYGNKRLCVCIHVRRLGMTRQYVCGKWCPRGGGAPRGTTARRRIKITYIIHIYSACMYKAINEHAVIEVYELIIYLFIFFFFYNRRNVQRIYFSYKTTAWVRRRRPPLERASSTYAGV